MSSRKGADAPEKGGRSPARVRTPSPPAGGLGPRRQPRQSRARDTVAAILQAAGELIASEGYAAMTTNKVARRAGVSIGSLYQYFPNKSAILVSLLEQHRAAVQPVIEASLAEQSDPGIPFADSTRRLFVRLQTLHADDPRLQRALAEEVPHPPHLRDRERRKQTAYVARVAEILSRRPDVQVVNATAAAQVLVQATGALAHWLAHSAPASVDRDAYIDEAVRLLTAYVQGTPRQPGEA